jgi:hypothetical protein
VPVYECEEAADGCELSGGVLGMRTRSVKDRQQNVAELKDKLASGRSPRWAFMERFVVPDYSRPDSDDDYLDRIRILQTPWWGVYLHKLGTPDPRPTLHDHPWKFFSIVLRGGYDEMRRETHSLPPSHSSAWKSNGELYPNRYATLHIVRRFNMMPFDSLHWISRLHRVPTWTLVFVGRRRRVWQYLDRDGTFTDFDRHEFNQQFLDAMDRRTARQS